MVHSLTKSLVSSKRWISLREKIIVIQKCKQYTIKLKRDGPLHKAEVPDLAKPFYDLRDEIRIVDEVACIGQRSIVPKSMRMDVLERMHKSHLGEEKYKARARGG